MPQGHSRQCMSHLCVSGPAAIGVTSENLRFHRFLSLQHHRVGASGNAERLRVLLHETVDVAHSLLL